MPGVSSNGIRRANGDSRAKTHAAREDVEVLTAREQGGLDPEASVTRDVVVTRETQVTVLVRFPFLLLDVILVTT